MRQLTWVAQYANGKVHRERELRDGAIVERNFRTLDLSQVISFGLEGSLRVGFQTGDGVIGCGGVPLHLSLITQEGDVFLITDRADVSYQNIVQFKKAHSAFSPGRGASNHLESYNIGYRIKAKSLLLGLWNAELIVSVSAKKDAPVEVELTLAAENDFKGQLCIRWGDEAKMVPTVLKPGTGNRIKFRLLESGDA